MLALQHQPRGGWRFCAQRDFRPARHTHIIQARLQEDRRTARMVRRGHPGLDRHVIGADKRAIIRVQCPHQAARPLPRCEDGNPDKRDGQDIAQAERVQLPPLGRQARQLQLTCRLQQPVAMAHPQGLCPTRRIRRAVRQRGDRPQRRLLVQQVCRFCLGNRPVAADPAHQEDDPADQEQERQHRAKGRRQLVERPGQRHGQEQDQENEQRPEGAAEREQAQPTARGRNFRPDRLQSVLFSQSGTCSSCSISSISGLRRIMSNRSPLTSTSGTRGRVL